MKHDCRTTSTQEVRSANEYISKVIDYTLPYSIQVGYNYFVVMVNAEEASCFWGCWDL